MDTNIIEIEVRLLDIDDLKPSEYNPRSISEKEYSILQDSLNEYGLVDPLIVNMGKGRENVIVGGHQRYRLLKEQGAKRVSCSIVYLDLEREQGLNLRLNANGGHWDEDKMLNIDDRIIQSSGLNIEQFSHEKPLSDEEPKRCQTCHQVLRNKKK